MSQSGESQEQGNWRSPRSSLEWITFGLASLVLAGVVGLVGFVWATKSQSPPIVSVTSKATLQDANGQFYVPFEVANQGGETATSVQVMAELQIGDRLETAEQQIDFLAEGEVQEGAFVFSQDPEQGVLTIRVASYTLP